MPACVGFWEGSMRRALMFSIAMLALIGGVAPSAADDQALCFRGGAGEQNIAACSRLISSNTLAANDLSNAYLRRGFLHGRRGERDDFDRTIADCNEALRVQPSNFHPLYIRAAVYIRRGDPDRALPDLSEAMRVAPQNSGVRNVFGSYYFAKGDDARALSELNEAIRISSGNAFAYRNRGLVYERMGELDKALADFRVALRGDFARTELLGRESAQGIERVEKRLAALRAPAVQPAPSTPSPVLPAARPGPSDTQASEPTRWIALVIGNAKYPDADPPLTEPARHARNFAEELRKSGYEVDVGEDLTKQELRRAVDGFLAKITPGSVALLFFSGYGIQADRQSYLIPVDAQVWAERDVMRDGLKLETVLRDMNDRQAAGKLVVVDASRRNPYERRFRGVSVGLAPVTAPAGSLVMYSAAPGQVASEDAGAFVAELSKEIRTPNITAEEAFIRTRMGLSNRTRGQQIPWVSSSLTTDLKFAHTGR
jgi:tetratricopeptide (TPR) repeat protein